MLYFPLVFGEWTIDHPIDTGALSSVISVAHCEKIKQIAPQKILKQGPAPDFEIMMDDGQLEAPIATTELHFEVSDVIFV